MEVLGGWAQVDRRTAVSDRPELKFRLCQGLHGTLGHRSLRE